MDRLERELKEYYEAEAAGRLRPPHRARRREACEQFARELALEDRHLVLDVGAGPASDHGSFVEQGIAYVGVDLSVGNGSIAAEQGQPVVPASLFELPFADGTFAAGWTMSTLQHVPDERIDEALVEFVRVLEPDSPCVVGLWSGADEVVRAPSSTTGIALPREFTLRSHERIRSVVARHLVVRSNETFAPDASGWEYHLARGRTPSPRRSTRLSSMGRAEGFEWSRRKNGDVVITHHGRSAGTLRGRRAAEFVDDVAAGDDQELMARLTGNYKRGNERTAKEHPRRRGRP